MYITLNIIVCAGQPCDYHMCENEGSCSTVDGVAMCACTSEWIGDYCGLNASVALQESLATGSGDGTCTVHVSTHMEHYYCVLCCTVFLSVLLTMYCIITCTLFASCRALI